MKTLYIETKMGAAGDMLMAALYDLLDQNEKVSFLEKINDIYPGIIKVSPEETFKCGIRGIHMKVEVLGQEENQDSHVHEHSHEHKHSHQHEHSHQHHQGHEHFSCASVLAHIEKLNIPNITKDKAKAIYQILGKAESLVHNTDIDNIHFHEVGSLDAVADVVGNCILLDMLHVDNIICSPIHVGNGFVKCAHGTLPVPAPATVQILKGIPYYTGNVDSELCTPTGAAILKYFVTKFDYMPQMQVEATGIGCGYKDFPQANILRVFLGQTIEEPADTICELSCNIDDMTGEEIGFALEALLEAGALDVFYLPIHMKKNRPGVLLKLFCKNKDKEKFRDLIFKYTSTKGMRYTNYSRYKLEDTIRNEFTPLGEIRSKTSSGYGFSKSKYEYEDLRKIAKEHDLSIQEVLNQIN